MSFSKLYILFTTCFLSAQAVAQFGPGMSVATDALEVNEIRALDMDGDQDLDIVLRQPSAIAWLENDGAGNFGALDTIFIATDLVGEFEMADTDADGDMDLLVDDPASSTILYLVNEGNGIFAAPLIVVYTEPNGVGSLVCNNMVGDVLPELIYRGTETVYWAINENGTFGMLDSLFVGGTQLSRGLFVWDMEGDGDNDFLTFSGLSADGRVGINPGGSGGSWTGTSLLPSFIHHHPYNLLDIDEDGDLDLVAADNWREYEFEVGSIGTFVSHSISGVAMGQVHAAAVSKFGCGNAVSAVRCSANFGNPGAPVEWTTFDAMLGEFGPVTEIPDLPSSQAIGNGDLDADGKEDLILWHDDSVLTWHRNVLVADTLPALNLDPFCYSGIPFISYELPAPGSWSGPGVIEGEFWAHTAGLGSHELVRTVDHGSGCVVSTSEPVSVISDPVVEPDFVDVCTTGVVQFTADQPGGVWIGTSADGSLDTDTLERPAYHSAQYRITDPAGATCSGSTVFNLFQIGHAIVSPHGPYCESDPPQQISVVGGGLLGGVFVENVPFLEVEVVTNYANSVTFDPSVGPSDYSFTVGMAAPMVCGQIDTITIHVDAAIPAFELSPFDTLCTSAVDFPLGEGPISGSTWSGDGVANGLFTPVGPFTDTFTDVRLLYSAVAGACAAEVETSIAVGGPVIDTLGWVESLCGNAESIQFVASPSGGSWAEPLEASGILDPSTVTETVPVGINVAYTYTDITGAACVDSLELITIEPVPDVTVSFSVLCSNDAAVELGGQGSPAGGWYFIDDPAAPLSELDPIVLTDSAYVLSYVYTDSFTGCTDTAATDFTVEICLNIGASIKHSLQVFPNPTRDGTFRITGQLPGTDLLLYDATGRVLWQRRAVGGNIPIEISGLATGMYHLVAKGVEGVQAIGVVVE